MTTKQPEALRKLTAKQCTYPQCKTTAGCGGVCSQFMSYAVQTPQPTTEHIDSPDCWCHPELVYKDPENGAEVWVHKEIQ